MFNDAPEICLGKEINLFKQINIRQNFDFLLVSIIVFGVSHCSMYFALKGAEL